MGGVAQTRPGLQIDPMRIYVLWAPSGAGQTDLGHRLTQELDLRLDNLGMVRNGVGFSIPVRHRSRPWRDGAAPHPIDLGAARHNVFVVVADDVMRAHVAVWDPYLETVLGEAEARGDLVIPLYPAFGAGLDALARRGTQGIVAPEPREDQPEAWARWLRRVAMYLIGCVWVHQRSTAGATKTVGDPRRIGVFISHAKLDGSSVAKLLRRFTDLARADRDDGIEVPPVNSVELYLDASDTIAASSFSKQFEDYIANGAMLAIITDAYHDRDWCLWEFLKAKEHRSPIVAWDLGYRGTSRRSPYIGNVPETRLPHVRYRRIGGDEADASNGAGDNETIGDRYEIDIATVSDADLETLILSLLSEALRMTAWSGYAQEVVDGAGIAATVVCARPPDLVDFNHADPDTAIVYPDPPINQHERELLQKSRPDLRIIPLSEVRA